MTTLIGLLFAFLCSISETAFAIITQKTKIDPAVLIVYCGLGVFIALLPVIFFVTPPTSGLFYVLTLANGLFASVGLRAQAEVIKKYGANIGTQFMTVPPVLVAISWWIINPNKFTAFFQETPFQAILAILCLVGICTAIWGLEHQKNTKKALIMSAPVFVCFSIQTFLTFYAVKEVSIIQCIVYYSALRGLIVGLANLYMQYNKIKTAFKKHAIIHTVRNLKIKFLQKQTEKGLIRKQVTNSILNKKFLKIALLIIAMTLISRFTRNLSLKFVPNPAYTILILNTKIIWVYIASRMMKLKSKISPLKGIILAFYAIAFIILTY